MSERSSNQHGGDSERWAIGNLDVVRSAPEAPAALALWTKIGLACLFLAVATPLVGLGGLWATALLGQLAAAGVEASHAKLPALELATDWDLRLAYVLALAVMGLRAGVSRLPRPTWRAAGLGPWHWWLLLGGGLWLASGAALVFERQLVDIADTVHLAILGGTWLWTTATAMWLIASLARAAVVLLAVAAQRSRIVSGSVAVVGLASMVVVAPVLANPDEILVADVRRNAPLLAAALEEVAAVERSLESLSTGKSRSSSALLPSGRGTTPALPPAGSGSVGDDRYTTAECMEALVKPEGARQRSRAGGVVEKLRARYPAHMLEVEDVVYWTMIDLCVDEPRRDDDKLTGLLFTASRNAMNDVVRHGQVVAKWQPTLASLRARCIIDGTDEIEEPEAERELRLATVIDALNDLEPKQRRLIEDFYLRRIRLADMASSREQTLAQVTKAKQRAVEKLRKRLESHCH